MLNKVCLTVDRYTKVEFVPQAEGVEPEIVIGIDKDHVEIFGEEADLIRFAEELYAKVTKMKRKLISERFQEYLKRNINNALRNGADRFKPIFQKYDLCTMKYGIDEGHHEMDCGLELFDTYAMTFIVDGERISIEVGDDFKPIVKNGEKTIQFSEYFNADWETSYRLGEFFLNFAKDQMVDKGWNQRLNK